MPKRKTSDKTYQDITKDVDLEELQAIHKKVEESAA
jgi:DNA-binding cell septation regulator SpoVG